MILNEEEIFLKKIILIKIPVKYKYLRLAVDFGWEAWAALNQITIIKSTY